VDGSEKDAPFGVAEEPTVRLRDAVAVGLIASIGAAPNLFVAPIVYDAGIAASAATFMLHGQFPYRDFWFLYGPGAGLLVAFPTWVFGPSMLLLRLLGLFVFFAQAAIGYWILRRSVAHFPAALVAVSAVAPAALLLGLEPSAWGVSTTLVFLALAIRISDSRRVLLSGVVLGFAFVTRLDVGAYGLIALLVFRDRTRLLLGFLSIAAPFVALMVARAPIQSLFEQLIWYPLIGQRIYRTFTSPDLFERDTLLISLPLAILPRIGILASVVRAGYFRKVDWATGLMLFAALSQLQTQARADFPHMAQAAPAGFLLLGIWAAGRPRSTRLVLVGAACAFSISVCALGVAIARQADDLSADLLSATATLASNTRTDEAVFVGLSENRYTVVNPLLAYYLADRRAAVRVAMYNPGITNSERVQREMTDQLEADETPLLLLETAPAQAFENENESHIPGSTTLDTYIDSHYEIACTFGTFSVLRRRDSYRPTTCIRREVTGPLGVASDYSSASREGPPVMARVMSHYVRLSVHLNTSARSARHASV
jgi:hypothetical protein